MALHAPFTQTLPFAPQSSTTTVLVPAAEHFTAQGQSIIIFPHAAQSVVDSTPTRTPGAPDCGLDLLLQFVVAPRAPLDRGCLGDLAPPDFTGTSLAPAILGTPDAWDN